MVVPVPRNLHLPHCRLCDSDLWDDLEMESGICSGCTLDQWERIQSAREQAYLEDDRNWESTSEGSQK